MPFTYNGTSYASEVIKINGLTGTVDGTFNSSLWNRVFDLVMDTSNRLIVSSGETTWGVHRLTSTGGLDPTFTTGMKSF